MKHIFSNIFSKEFIPVAFFAAIALISLSFFFLPGETKKTIEQKVEGSSKTAKPLPTTIEQKNTTYPTAVPTEKNESGETIQITVVVTPTPKSVPDKAKISISIDGSAPFFLDLDKGKNQCDVLQQSLQDKKISQLLMKYDPSLDAYGVYQINGRGKDNAVWWTYEVNSKSPTVGCNHIAANDGDSVSWKYVGSQ